MLNTGKNCWNLFKGIQITKTSNDAHYHVFLANVGLSMMIRLISPEIHLEKHQYILLEVRLVWNLSKSAIVNPQLELFLNTTNIVPWFYHPTSVHVKMEYVNQFHERLLGKSILVIELTKLQDSSSKAYSACHYHELFRCAICKIGKFDQVQIFRYDNTIQMLLLPWPEIQPFFSDIS